MAKKSFICLFTFLFSYNVMPQIYESDVTDDENNAVIPEDKIYEDSEYSSQMRGEIEQQEEALSAEEEKWNLEQEDNLLVEEIE